MFGNNPAVRSSLSINSRTIFHGFFGGVSAKSLVMMTPQKTHARPSISNYRIRGQRIVARLRPSTLQTLASGTLALLLVPRAFKFGDD